MFTQHARNVVLRLQHVLSFDLRCSSLSSDKQLGSGSANHATRPKLEAHTPSSKISCCVGTVVRAICCCTTLVPVVAVFLDLLQLKLFVDSHFTDWSVFASAALVLP
jgi:hypothetical protein